MSRTIQIRGLDDDVYAELQVRAAEAGLTVPGLLRREASKLAARPTMAQWLERTRRRPADLSRDEIVTVLDDLRGSWPEGRR